MPNEMGRKKIKEERERKKKNGQDKESVRPLLPPVFLSLFIRRPRENKGTTGKRERRGRKGTGILRDSLPPFLGGRLYLSTEK